MTTRERAPTVRDWRYWHADWTKEDWALWHHNIDAIHAVDPPFYRPLISATSRMLARPIGFPNELSADMPRLEKVK